VIEAHLPDRSEALAEGLGRLARAADGPSEARATMVALVLTSPEYQLF
jgi:hypothetical protein